MKRKQQCKVKKAFTILNSLLGVRVTKQKKETFSKRFLVLKLNQIVDNYFEE